MCLKPTRVSCGVHGSAGLQLRMSSFQFPSQKAAPSREDGDQENICVYVLYEIIPQAKTIKQISAVMS